MGFIGYYKEITEQEKGLVYSMWDFLEGKKYKKIHLNRIVGFLECVLRVE